MIDTAKLRHISILSSSATPTQNNPPAPAQKKATPSNTTTPQQGGSGQFPKIIPKASQQPASSTCVRSWIVFRKEFCLMGTIGHSPQNQAKFVYVFDRLVTTLLLRFRLFAGREKGQRRGIRT